MSSSEIMRVLGLKDRKSFSELYLNAALSENAIERKYPDTPKHPRQQYRLTTQAKEWKANFYANDAKPLLYASTKI